VAPLITSVASFDNVAVTSSDCDYYILVADRPAVQHEFLCYLFVNKKRTNDKFVLVLQAAQSSRDTGLSASHSRKPLTTATGYTACCSMKYSFESSCHYVDARSADVFSTSRQ
jgi:hypothetical protein